MTFIPKKSVAPKLKNTSAVIVTYANRYEFVYEVVQAIIEIGLAKIIIVDNGSPTQNRLKLEELASCYPSIIEMKRLPENTGSAGGFHYGLKCAMALEIIQFIWMLDDDNKPRLDSYEKLCQTYNLLGSSPKFTLLSLRRSRLEYLKAATIGKKVGIKPGSFLGFHIFDWVKQKIVPETISTTVINERYNNPIISVGYAPYGGFFLHKSWLSLVAPPNKNFYLYSDDHDFTMRIKNHGGTIYLCAQSQLDELETSWGGVSSGVGDVPFLMRPDIDNKKIYCFIRNRVYLESQYSNKSLIYCFNVMFLVIKLSILSLPKAKGRNEAWSRLKLIIRAFKDGKSGKFSECRDSL